MKRRILINGLKLNLVFKGIGKCGFNLKILFFLISNRI